MLDLAGNGAVISECGRYRYRLDRHVGGAGQVAAFFGINPSTADASVDDATVRKWRGFSERQGFSRFIVGNVFAFRATDVRELASAGDPVGEQNRERIFGAFGICQEADVLVPCWGARGKVPKNLWPVIDTFRDRLKATGLPVMCWGLTSSGDPKHPLMLGYDTPLVDL